MTETQEHIHNHEVPVIVSDDNVAKVNVSVEERELEPYKKQYIKEKRKHVVLKGFRKGMAPEEMVSRFFKDEARQSARDNVVYGKYMKLLQEHKLQPLSEPRVDHMHDDAGKIVAELVVDVLQPVVLGQYLGLEIEAISPHSVGEALVKTIAQIKESYPKLTTVESTVGNDHVIIADFTVTDGNKELEKQNDFQIRLGKNLYFPPFETQILGMASGENKEFDIEFPETYHKEEFKGRSIHFNLTVKEVKTVSEHSNEELAKVLSYENEEKMTELLTKEIEAKFKDDEHLFYENQILGQLLSTHQFKIPRKLIDNEIVKLRTEQPNMPAEKAEEIADRFVRTDLVLHSIYERHPDIQFNQEQFNAKVAELAARANDTVEGTIQKLQTSGKLQSYINYLSNCKVIDFLIEMADKKEPVEVVNTNKENE